MQGKQADGHLRNHLLSTVEEGEFLIWNPIPLVPCSLLHVPNNYTVRHFERAPCGFIDGKCGYALLVWITEVFADVHLIVRIAVLQHPLGDGRRRMFAVGKDTKLGRALDKGSVELRPGPPRQGYDSHVMIRQDEAVRQHLQGVECRIDLDVGFGELASERIGEAEEERVARGKDDNRK